MTIICFFAYRAFVNGKCWSWHQWLTILHYNCDNQLVITILKSQPIKMIPFTLLLIVDYFLQVGWQTCCIWKGVVWNGCGLQNRSWRKAERHTEEQSCDCWQWWNSSVIIMLMFQWHKLGCFVIPINPAIKTPRWAFFVLGSFSS